MQLKPIIFESLYFLPVGQMKECAVKKCQEKKNDPYLVIMETIEVRLTRAVACFIQICSLFVLSFSLNTFGVELLPDLCTNRATSKTD